jgi:UDP-N-acetylmuramoylalanine--D-glutamate ligase
VILNVTKNHLDEYNNNFSAYKKGKFSLIESQKKDYIAILNYDNIHTRKHIDVSKGTPVPYSSQRELPIGVYVKNGWVVDRHKLSSGQVVNQRICLLDKICLLGRHNLSNILAAVAATRAARVPVAIIRKVIEKFRGIPQRLELIYQKNGVQFVNDSASTTPESTIAALESFEQGSVSLICGGDAKGMDYAKLASTLRSKKVRVVALKSPLASILKKSLKNKLKIVETLQEAVKISTKNAEKGEVILLSPAAAWFCYFSGKIPLGGRGFERFVRLF